MRYLIMGMVRLKVHCCAVRAPPRLRDPLIHVFRRSGIILNRFLAAPREGHLSWLVNLFVYLQRVTGRRKVIVVYTEVTKEMSGKVDNVKYWLDNYPHIHVFRRSGIIL